MPIGTSFTRSQIRALTAERVSPLSPLEVLENLSALVSLPWAHLVRYGGCLAPHNQLRVALQGAAVKAPGGGERRQEMGRDSASPSTSAWRHGRWRRGEHGRRGEGSRAERAKGAAGGRPQGHARGGGSRRGPWGWIGLQPGIARPGTVAARGGPLGRGPHHPKGARRVHAAERVACRC